MVDLAVKTPLEDLLPLTIGSVTISEPEHVVLTSIAPFNEQDKKVSDVLKSAQGMAAPAPNRATGKEGARAIWFGHRMIVLQGSEPDAKLSKYAAVTDQSDAWAIVRIEGQEAADVLARLTPIDLRDSHFKRGHTARTELMHMMASITRIGAQSYQVMVFRGFAQTLVHDLKTAMQSVAARAD